MPDISKETLYEIQKEARHYLSSAKGVNFSAEDLVIAENLIVFGYLRGLEEMKDKLSKTIMENRGIISSEWK